MTCRTASAVAMRCKVRMLKLSYLCESGGFETAAIVMVTFCRRGVRQGQECVGSSVVEKDA